MKHFLLFITFLPTLLFAQAEEFAPIGAIWHYTQRTINPQLTSFTTLESLSDTTIAGVDCKKIIEVERYIDTTGVAYHYMFSRNDSVFFYADDDFHLLYDFGAMAGDTIVLDYYNTYDDTPLKMIIDSTETIMINGHERKIQYITCGDGILIGFGQNVIEGIGSNYFMFPIGDLPTKGPLRCYQDDFIGLYYNPLYIDDDGNYEDCEQIITSINERDAKARISIFPNPTKNSVTIQNLENQTSFKVFSVSGKLLKRGIIVESGQIDLSELSKGIYFIEFENENMQTVKKIIVE